MKLKAIKEGLKYSIIIVSYNTIAELSRCIESVQKNTESFEIIVVDNGSVDGSVGYMMNVVGQHDNVKFIENGKNMNFGPANNQGIELAEGEHIILLNSDTIVTVKWAERLLECLTHRRDVAMVGPVSNSSNGRQNVPGYFDEFKKVHKYIDYDAAAMAWGNSQGRKFIDSGILYGWCMFVNREFLKGQDCLFDDQFKNAYEDNDLCHRALIAGWKLFIDYGTIIYHRGQASFKKEYTQDFYSKYMQNGHEMQDLFFKKWKAPDEQKLIAVYRIANCEKYISESMKRTSEFADEIICLIARSQDNTESIARSFPKVKIVEVWTEPDHPFDEQAERDWLLQKAIERGATWVISVDGDEVYEEKFVSMVPKLMRPKNPHVYGYWCNWRTLWDKEGDVLKYRADSTFGAFQNYRFFRVLPGMKIEKNRNIYNHHCGSAPVIARENLEWINVRVKHLGYDTPEQRQKKYEFYRKNDPRPVLADVGTSDYHHLITKSPLLKTWTDKNRVSVMTICKNEGAWIYRMMQNVGPIADEFVIVDTGSTDNTIEEVERYARRHNVDVIIHKKQFTSDENGMLMNYSEAKNWAKSKCRYEWILNMDADESFEPRHVGTLFAMIDEDCDGFLFSVLNYLKPPVSNKPEENEFGVSETIRLFRNIPELFYSGLIHESIEDSITVRVKTGRGKIIQSPIELHHRGYLKNKEYVRSKVDRYHLINQKQFEVSGQADPRPLFNMAMHYMSDGDVEKSLECYMKCLELEPNFWRAKQNLAWHHMSEAKRLLSDLVHSAPRSHVEKNPRVKVVMDFFKANDFSVRKVC